MGDTAARRRGSRLVYLYCVVEAGTEAQRLLDSRQVPGLDPREPLFGVEADGIVGAVSRVPASVFGVRPLNALVADLPRLTPFAVQHEAAVRALLTAAPALVPMTFGAVYRGTGRVAGMLRRRGDELRRLLEQVRGKHEWSLKLLADPVSTARAVQSGSPALRRFDDEAESSGPGRAYLLRKRRGQMLEAETERVLGQAVVDVFQRLAAASADARREEVPGPKLQVPSPKSQGNDVGPGTWDVGLVSDLRLVMKAAFLVEAAAGDAFRAAAGELQTTYRPLGLSFELSGPWAAYSFVPHAPGAAFDVPAPNARPETQDQRPETQDQRPEQRGVRRGIA